MFYLRVVAPPDLKAGALIGVFISFTTVPAAANIAVAMAYGNRAELLGAAEQLGINISMLIVAGLLTLMVQRPGFARRKRAIVNRAASE